jgi:hypothetical protein
VQCVVSYCLFIQTGYALAIQAVDNSNRKQHKKKARRLSSWQHSLSYLIPINKKFLSSGDEQGIGSYFGYRSLHTFSQPVFFPANQSFCFGKKKEQKLKKQVGAD